MTRLPDNMFYTNAVKSLFYKENLEFVHSSILRPLSQPCNKCGAQRMENCKHSSSKDNNG